MACHGARRLIEMNNNLANIIGIELLTAAQGIHFRKPLVTSKALQAVIRCLRKKVTVLGDDRYMADDLKNAGELIHDGTIVKAIKNLELPAL